MQVARLHGPRDIRIAAEPAPPLPGPGEVTLKIKTVGLCGSDLHMYETGRIGYTVASQPFVLGHEFMGEVAAVGADALDGLHQPLKLGQRVAVEPAVPCWRCELCETGHPNLCPNHIFYGLFPEDGALRERMNVSARNCFPLPDSLSDEVGPLLETLGVAIHAIDLSKIRIGGTVAVLGAGPVGLLITRLAVLAGASQVFAFDKFDWRLRIADAWGAAYTYNVDDCDPADVVLDLPAGAASMWQSKPLGPITRCGRRLTLRIGGRFGCWSASPPMTSCGSSIRWRGARADDHDVSPHEAYLPAAPFS